MARLDGPEVEHLRRAIALAHEARERGNAPFGAVLIGGEGKVLAEGKNTVTTGGDVTGHAETNLVRRAYVSFDEQTLAASTLYASAEPCPMCSGAVFSAGVGRVVYGLGPAGSTKCSPPTRRIPRCASLAATFWLRVPGERKSWGPRSRRRPSAYSKVSLRVFPDGGEPRLSVAPGPTYYGRACLEALMHWPWFLNSSVHAFLRAAFTTSRTESITSRGCS